MDILWLNAATIISHLFLLAVGLLILARGAANRGFLVGFVVGWAMAESFFLVDLFRDLTGIGW